MHVQSSWQWMNSFSKKKSISISGTWFPNLTFHRFKGMFQDKSWLAKSIIHRARYVEVAQYKESNEVHGRLNQFLLTFGCCLWYKELSIARVLRIPADHTSQSSKDSERWCMWCAVFRDTWFDHRGAMDILHSHKWVKLQFDKFCQLQENAKICIYKNKRNY